MSENFSQDDYAALAASADNRTGRGINTSGSKKPIPPVAWAALALAGLVGFFFLTEDVTTNKKITDPDSEEFSTISPIPPTIPPDQVTAAEEEPDEKFVVVEPEVAIAPPPPIIQPAIQATPVKLEEAPPITKPAAPAVPSVQVPGGELKAEEPVDNSEEIARLRALREAEVERLRQLAAEEEAERLARLKSPLIVFDDSEEDDEDDANATVAPSTQQAARAGVPQGQN